MTRRSSPASRRLVVFVSMLCAAALSSATIPSPAQGQSPAAEPAAFAAFRERPISALAANLEGCRSGQAGALEAAVRLFTTAIEMNPRFAEAYCNRGTIWHQSGRSDLALLDINRCLQLAPDYSPAYYHRANIVSARGDWAAADCDYSIALKLTPNFGAAWLNRGRLRRQLSHWSAAESDLRSALAIQADAADVHLELARLYLQMASGDSPVEYGRGESRRDRQALAVRHAELACRLTGWQRPDCVQLWKETHTLGQVSTASTVHQSGTRR